MKRLNKKNKSIIFLAIISIIILVNIVIFVFFFQTDTLTKMIVDGENINLLFIITENDELKFMDLFLYNPVTNKGGLFYIPPNLGLKIQSLDRYDKISVIFDKNNLRLYIEELERITDTPVPFYCLISVEEISHIVDLVGGVEIFIANPIGDNTDEEESILIPLGSVMLDGDKIKLYISYENNDENTMEIVSMRHKVIKAILKQFGEDEIASFLLDNKAFNYLKSYLNPNFSSEGLKTFLKEMKELEIDKLVYKRVEGKVEGVEDEILYPLYDGELIKLSIKQILETLSKKDEMLEDSVTVKLEILNGTDIAGLAGKTKILFESYDGIEVVKIGNADNDNYVHTVMINKSNNEIAINRIAEIIGLKGERIYPDYTYAADNDVDLILILGRDFSDGYCQEE